MDDARDDDVDDGSRSRSRSSRHIASHRFMPSLAALRAFERTTLASNILACERELASALDDVKEWAACEEALRERARESRDEGIELLDLGFGVKARVREHRRARVFVDVGCGFKVEMTNEEGMSRCERARREAEAVALDARERVEDIYRARERLRRGIEELEMMMNERAKERASARAGAGKG